MPIPSTIEHGPVCEACGFAPVTDDAWRGVVLANLGENAKAAFDATARAAFVAGLQSGIRIAAAQIQALAVQSRIDGLTVETAERIAAVLASM